VTNFQSKMVGFIAPSIHFNNFTPPSPHKSSTNKSGCRMVLFSCSLFYVGLLKILDMPTRTETKISKTGRGQGGGLQLADMHKYTNTRALAPTHMQLIKAALNSRHVRQELPPTTTITAKGRRLDQERNVVSSS